MLVYCAKACNICHYKGDLEQLMRERLEQKQKEEEMERELLKTKYGVEQTRNEEDAKEQKTYEDMIQYMDHVVMVEPKYESVREDCKLRHAFCIFWASIGECEKTRDYMVVQCAPACQTCEMLDFHARCPHDPDEATALQPGDLNRMFERIVQTMDQYQPVILSQPNPTDPNIFDGPWVVTLENFLTDHECDRLIELGGTVGYLESADVGEKKWDGTFLFCFGLGLVWCHSQTCYHLGESLLDADSHFWSI